MGWIYCVDAVFFATLSSVICHQSKALYRRHTVSGHRVVSDDALAGSLLVGSCGAARTHVESRGPGLVHWVRLTPG